jgi:hypothetical protein
MPRTRGSSSTTTTLDERSSPLIGHLDGSGRGASGASFGKDFGKRFGHGGALDAERAVSDRDRDRRHAEDGVREIGDARAGRHRQRGGEQHAVSPPRARTATERLAVRSVRQHEPRDGEGC